MARRLLRRRPACLRTAEITALTLIVLALLHASLRRPSSAKNTTERTVRLTRLPDARVSGETMDVNSQTHLAIVICGSRTEQGIVSIKSAVVMARRPLSLHVFLDAKRVAPVTQFLVTLKTHYPNKVTYRVYDARFPSIVNHAEWNRIYGPCATLRLFFPRLLSHVDRVLYIDSDTVFVRPPEHLWDHFGNFGKHQIMAASYDHIVKRDEFVPRKKSIPLYKPGRLQSGVLLMELKRMRSFGWIKNVLKFADFWRNKDNFTSHLFDQAAINVVFYFNPEKLYLIDCDWNFRPYHFLMNGHECAKAEEDGVSLIHGYQYAFHGDVPSAFKSIYWAFRKFEPGTQAIETLLEESTRNLQLAIESDEKKRSPDKFELFLKQFRNFV